MKKILLFGMAFIILLSFAACEDSEETALVISYNAVMYGNPYEVRQWLRNDFYEENLTYNSWSKVRENYVKDDAYPKSRTLIITEQSKFDAAFKEFPLEVDFEKEMVVMWCITTASGNELIIVDVTLDDQILCIKYGYPVSKEPNAPNASMPLTKWTVVKLDKLNITAAEFKS